MTNELKCPTCKDKKKIVKIAVGKDLSPFDYCDGQGYEIDCPDCCAKSEERIKCPVCGERMKQLADEYIYCCANRKCPEEQNFKSTIRIQQGNELVQSRIDKEKAAAVQQERERVKKDAKTGGDTIRIGLENVLIQDEIPFGLSIHDLLERGMEILNFNGLSLEINQNVECSCKAGDIAPCRQNCIDCILFNFT